ncbi:hypothetical protein AB0N05_08625 [Nocardia sp. NPDC051030]|uniref:hypothetical protein n=1 Tax=Nocardia sp. NPDC051030 TaxID=3155162 RepID=UPI00343C2CC6
MTGAVLAVLAGVLLLAGLGGRSRVVKAIGSLAAGTIFGVTLTVVFITASTTLAESELSQSSLGAGFWILLIATGVGLAALVLGLPVQRASSGESNPGAYGAVPQRGRASGTDIATGVLLALVAVMLIVGSFLQLIGDSTWTTWELGIGDQSSTQLTGVSLLLAAMLALLSAALLFIGLGARGRVARGLGSVAAGMAFGVAFTVIFDVVSTANGADQTFQSTEYKAGFWVLVAVGVVSFCAAIASLILNIGAAQPPTYPPAPQYNSPGGYSPMPNNPAPQQYYGPPPTQAQPWNMDPPQ